MRSDHLYGTRGWCGMVVESGERTCLDSARAHVTYMFAKSVRGGSRPRRGGCWGEEGDRFSTSWEQ